MTDQPEKKAREFWIEMSGDPKRDHEMRSRVMAGYRIESYDPSIEVLHVREVTDSDSVSVPREDLEEVRYAYRSMMMASDHEATGLAILDRALSRGGE